MTLDTDLGWSVPSSGPVRGPVRFEVVQRHAKRALTSIHDAAQAATRAVTGSNDPDDDSPRWIPHITVCYSTAEQAMAPIIAALGPRARECQIQISTVSLVIQHGPERLWNRRTVGAVYLPVPG
ncbi:MAG TPA: hypothetical protein VG009_02595 [Candidatus Dormibacteraeota bacterium]|nr:hypothetical protein [Candidatus Dormibacteraeota bacterium]